MYSVGYNLFVMDDVGKFWFGAKKNVSPCLDVRSFGVPTADDTSTRHPVNRLVSQFIAFNRSVPKEPNVGDNIFCRCSMVHGELSPTFPIRVGYSGCIFRSPHSRSVVRRQVRDCSG